MRGVSLLRPNPPSDLDDFRYAPKIAAVSAALIGATWLFLWALGIAPRWSATGIITVKTNMALAQLLGGAALFAFASGEPSSRRRWVGIAAAVLVLLIGAFTLGEHLFRIDLGIDQLLATEAPGAIATASPNRLGLPGSVSLTLLGVGLLLAYTKRATAPYFGVIVFLINVLPAIGYIYGISAFYGRAQTTGIAWPTVAALMLLGLGLVFASRDRGPASLLLSQGAGGMLLRRLLPAALLIPLVLGFVTVQVRNRELVDRPTGIGLLVIASALIFSVLLWRSAAHLSRLAGMEAEAVRAARQSDERFRALVTASSDALYRMSPDWTEMRQLGGGGFIADTEISNRNWREEYIHPDDHSQVMAVVKEAIRSKSIFEMEHRVRRVDGSLGWTFSRAIPVQDTGGEIVEWFGAASDITVRKEAEQQLQKVNRTLRAIHDSNQSLLRATKEGTLLEEVCRIITEDCGYATVWIGHVEHDEGKTVRVVAHSGFDYGYLETLAITWGDTARGRGPTGTAIRTAQPTLCRNMLTDPNFGPWREEALKHGYASSLALPLVADHNVIGSITIYSKEVDAFSGEEVELLAQLADDLAYGIGALRIRSAHGQAEAALRHSEERLAAIVNSAMDAIITIDQAQRIVMFNVAAESTFGYSASEAIGQSLDILLPERFTESHRIHIQRFGDTGVTSRAMSPSALFGRRKDGQEFPLEATISQVAAGGQKLYTVILRDITQRKKTEEMLMRSEKLATVGRLTATIAHEINNPLSSVTDLLFLVRSDASIAPASRRYLELAEMELQRASQIANTTLGLSKQTPTRLRVPEILEGVLALLNRKLKDGKVVIEKELPAEPLEIVGIAGEIRQVLWNLLNNAVDAVQGQGRIVVRLSGSADWRQLLIRGARITIADDGSGIEREALRHIFEPFFTTKDTGTGLGLWVTSEIVLRHGGTIKVRSLTSGSRHGTVFSIFIPGDGQSIKLGLDSGTKQRADINP
jgi:PAS domain S-box-containing protein